MHAYICVIILCHLYFLDSMTCLYNYKVREKLQRFEKVVEKLNGLSKLHLRFSSDNFTFPYRNYPSLTLLLINAGVQKWPKACN